MEAMTGDESSLLPQPPPEVPKRPFWFTLAAPPVLTLVSGAVILILSGKGDPILFGVLMTLFGIIPGLSFHFHDAVAKRYRGPSLVFMVCTYLLGQFIVCLVLWIVIGLLIFAV